ncbi:MAG: T9SS type A sorting domain-containing protein [Candidatus Zixiibacteriota bacterium]|nr:MAG: T9SS type A sorting domain-containing protein [candidate division Zixibacteria bacterium]
MLVRRILMLFIIALVYQSAPATVIHVPGDYPTIQQGIDACSDYDTVMVANGTYLENINIPLPLSLIGQNRDSVIIDGSGVGDVILIDTSYVFVSNFTITNSGSDVEDAGIELSYTADCVIDYCKFEDNYSGISMYGAANNCISRCEFSDQVYGIYFRDIIPGPMLSNISNTVQNSIIQNSDSFGVNFSHVLGSYHRSNLIAGNRIINNDTGISSITCQGNTFIFNQIETSNHYGIHHSRCICGGELNHFDHNNFISNNGDSVQAIDFGSGSDYWYSITEEEGNYWSDYTGPDTNGNGIGDIPYDIDGGEEQDLYPLMLPLKSEISGVVSDGSDPIAGVYVQALGTSVDDYTDNNGFYSLDGLGAGMYDIGFLHPLYQSVYERGVPATLDNITNLDVVMDPITEVSENNAPMPTGYMLLKNYPNPFNASTTIRYSLQIKSEVTLSVYNLLGQGVETLFEGTQNPGEHTLNWDASHLPSGIYFAKLEAAEQTKNIKMVLLK